MAEYIDRDALRARMREILFEIFNTPAADVVPVVHGHWENVEPAIWAGDYATCSVCRKRQTLEKLRNFCPNCGAKMEEEGNG